MFMNVDKHSMLCPPMTKVGVGRTLSGLNPTIFALITCSDVFALDDTRYSHC
jgi:hypothetical protein